MKIPKWSLIFAFMALAVGLILTLLPDFVVGYIEANMSSDVPSYKFAEAIELWKINKVAIFQPLSYLFYVVAAVLFIYALAKWAYLNYEDIRGTLGYKGKA